MLIERITFTVVAVAITVTTGWHSLRKLPWSPGREDAFMMGGCGLGLVIAAWCPPTITLLLVGALPAALFAVMAESIMAFLMIAAVMGGAAWALGLRATIMSITGIHLVFSLRLLHAAYGELVKVVTRPAERDQLDGAYGPMTTFLAFAALLCCFLALQTVVLWPSRP